MTDYKQLCAKVLAYYEGQDEYDFSHLSAIARDNAAFDAWQELRAELKTALAEPKPEGPSDQKLHGYWISTSPSGQLTRQQVDAFLDRHKDPEDARRFLQEAGLIDQYGELARPYRQEQP